MASGGKRPGAGAKRGSTQKIPRALVATKLGPRIIEVLTKYLNSDDPVDQKWAVQVAMPYAIQKQPTAIEGTGENGEMVLKVIFSGIDD